MRLKPALTAALLGALLLLPACSDKPASGREAELERETAALRTRVERLEQDSASERARLAADIATLRQEMRELHAGLEEAARSLAASGKDSAVTPGSPGQPEKSPRQALRDSLRGMLESTRAALERLSLELDKKLAQPPKPETPER